MPRMVADNLMSGEGASLRLLACRSKATGRLRFPCPEALGDDDEIVRLHPRGRLWTFTVQRFAPKAPYDGEADPAKFKPYAVGYIELDGQLIVESRIICPTPEDLRIGDEMVLTTEAYRFDESGEVLTYAFRPAMIEAQAHD